MVTHRLKHVTLVKRKALATKCLVTKCQACEQGLYNVFISLWWVTIDHVIWQSQTLKLVLIYTSNEVGRAALHLTITVPMFEHWRGSISSLNKNGRCFLKCNLNLHCSNKKMQNRCVLDTEHSHTFFTTHCQFCSGIFLGVLQTWQSRLQYVLTADSKPK